MGNSINFNFNSPSAKPTDELEDSYRHDGIGAKHPEQSPDGEEYLCGNPGPEHDCANQGRDQDRSRQDECVPASPFSRYVSG